MNTKDLLLEANVGDGRFYQSFCYAVSMDNHELRLTEQQLDRKYLKRRDAMVLAMVFHKLFDKDLRETLIDSATSIHDFLVDA